MMICKKVLKRNNRVLSGVVWNKTGVIICFLNMDKKKIEHLCSRCRKTNTREEICSRCISELLELHDHRIGWKMALEIEREERDGENISIETQ